MSLTLSLNDLGHLIATTAHGHEVNLTREGVRAEDAGLWILNALRAQQPRKILADVRGQIVPVPAGKRGKIFEPGTPEARKAINAKLREPVPDLF